MWHSQWGSERYRATLSKWKQHDLKADLQLQALNPNILLLSVHTFPNLFSEYLSWHWVPSTASLEHFQCCYDSWQVKCIINMIVLHTVCPIKFLRYRNSLEVSRPDCLFVSQMICFTKWFGFIAFYFRQHHLLCGIIICHGWNACSCKWSLLFVYICFS